MHTSSTIEKNFFFALLLVVLLFVIAVFYPFLTIIVLAGAFCVVLNPVYKWIKRRITKDISWAASLITVILFVILLCGPLLFIGSVVFNQAQHAYTTLVNPNNTDTFISTLDTSINSLMPNGFTFDTSSKVADVVSFLSKNMAAFFTSTLKTLIMFVLMILTMFYFLKDGRQWKRSLMALSPLSEHNTGEIFAQLTSSIDRILKGSFLIAIIQGLLVGFGFTIFGVPNGALWAVVAGMASFIPTVGTSIVTIPAVLFLFFMDMHTQALGLLIWSGVLVGLVDNMLAPFVISKNTEISSLFILFSILGGITLIGPIGVLLGPLALSLLYCLISIYRKGITS